MPSFRTVACFVLCVLILGASSPVLARDIELKSGQPAAVGVGFEVSHGDYGVSAEATLITLPLSFFLQPMESLDLTLEVPLLNLSRRSGSAVVATGSGGAARGQGAKRTGGAPTGSMTENQSGLGDVNLTLGWILLPEGEAMPKVRSTLYGKAPSGDADRGLGTGTTEAGPGLSVSKWLGRVQLFGEAAYIFQNSTVDYAGRNYVSYLFGAGIQAAERLFVGALVKGSTSRVEGADSQSEGRLKFNFLQSRRVSWEVYGAVGFTDASPDVGGGLSLVYQF